MLSYFDVKNIIMGQSDSAIPVDDFRIIDSYAIYDEDKNCAPAERKLQYLCYEIESMNPDTGERQHFYKALKFVRVDRVPKSAKQSTSLMDMQQQILAGAYSNGYNLITIIANLIKPAIGVLFLYGVQGTGKTIEEAKEKVHNDFIGLTRSYQATFRVLEMRCINAQETEWLREKMFQMKYMAVVRGIPKASKSGEDAGNKGLGGNNLNPDSQGTLEEFIAGMVDYEYVLQVLSTPVYMKTLREWSIQTQKYMTDWSGQLQGTKSFSFGMSLPMMVAANQSNSQGWSKAYTDADSVTHSTGESFSTGYGESVSQSLSHSYSESMGITHGTSVTDSVSQSQSISNGTTFGQTLGQSIGDTIGQTLGQSTGLNSSVSASVGESQNISEGQSINHSVSEGAGSSFGTSQSQSYGQNFGQSISNSHSVGTSQSFGQTIGETIGQSNTATVGQTTGTSNSQSYNQGWSNSTSVGSSASSGTNSGISHSQGNSITDTTGYGTNTSVSQGTSVSANAGFSAFGVSAGISASESASASAGESFNSSQSVGSSSSDGYSFGESSSVGSSQSASAGTSAGVSVGSSSSFSNSYSQSESLSHSISNSISNTYGTSESYGVSTGQTMGESFGLSSGVNQSQSFNSGVSNGWGSSISTGSGVSVNNGFSQGQSISSSLSDSASQSFSNSMSNSQSISQSISNGVTAGRSVGQSVSNSYTQGVSQGTSEGYSQSQNISQGVNNSESVGISQSVSTGGSGAYVSGMSSSMGFGPSVGYNKSFQWVDQQVKDILQMLEFQNERFKKSLSANEGAFYTYIHIACPSTDALSAAQAVAKATWQNEFALVNPFQVLHLTQPEQQHLLYHFAAFSYDITYENIYGVRQQKYGTVLLPQEFVAYTHLPRITHGGVFADINDIPQFSVASGLKGEIYMGTILNPKIYSMTTGYKTPYEFRIDEQELMHGYFTGASRSGKTVAAMRFVAELANVTRKDTGKKLRIVCMDPKSDWRTLARFVDPDRFRFFSLGNDAFRPIKINPFKIPKNVVPQTWIDGVIDIYCRAYGLLERGKQMMGETIYALYEDAGVFEACNDDNWTEIVPELSREVCFTKVYAKMSEIKARLEDPSNPKGRAGNDTRDAYARLLDRLQCFSRDFSIETKLFGTSEGVGIDELIGDDDVTILESSGLEKTFKNFIFGVITSGFYKFAKAHEGGYLAKDQYETVLVIEEANEVLIGNDCAANASKNNETVSGQSEFEEILDQSAGYGLFIIAITQKISNMPTSIIANSGLVFAGRLKIDKDMEVVMHAIGRETRLDDRELFKWFAKMETGMFICQRSRTFNFKDAEPFLIQVARLNALPPSNLEIDELLTRQSARQMSKVS